MVVVFYIAFHLSALMLFLVVVVTIDFNTPLELKTNSSTKANYHPPHLSLDLTFKAVDSRRYF